MDDIFGDDKPKNTLIGKKHFLEEDGIQIQLPENLERLSNAEYSDALKKLAKDKKFQLQQKTFDYTRKLNGNSYIYFDKNSKLSYLINSIPYEEITKDDAQKLLGIIRQNQKNAKESIKVDYTKITAKHTEITGAQIFKAIFKADLKKGKDTFYEHTYYISSNEKSVLINIMTLEESNFDKYIEKMIF